MPRRSRRPPLNPLHCHAAQNHESPSTCVPSAGTSRIIVRVLRGNLKSLWYSVSNSTSRVLLHAASWLEDHSLAGLAVHHDDRGRIESQMPHASMLFHRWLCRKPRPIEEPFAGIGIHREISDLKCGKVLEEMAALRRRDAKVAKAAFDDDARAGN